jgi:PAS domain S-box-containing protein
MQISELILTSRENNDNRKQLNFYRTILLLSSSFTLLLGYLFQTETSPIFDPPVIRAAFSLGLLMVFVLTFFEKLRDKMIYVNYTVFALYSFYGLVLIYKNNFEINYILEYIILTIIICFAFKNKIHVNIFIGLVFLSYAITCIIFKSSFQDIFLNITLLGIFCAVILIFFDSRIAMEEELRVREDLLNTVFNESPDAMFIADPSTAIVTNCNNRALTMFAIDARSHIIGNNLNYLLKYPNSPGAWNNFKKKFERKKFLVQELEFKTVSNNFFWGSQAITEINVSGHIYWLIRITDITERVRDKRTIDENRKILKQVIDLVPHQIFLKDSQSRFLLVNKAVADIYKTTPEEMVGKGDADFMEDFLAERTVLDDMEVIEKGREKFISEENIKDYKGNTRILQTIKIPFYLEDERKPGVLGISLDITERVKDKQTIEENTKMLRQIIDLVPHQIYLKDSHSTFLLVNEAVANIHGKTVEEMIGKSDFDLFPDEEATEFLQIERDIITTGRTRFIPEERSTDPDGSVRIMNTIKIPFYLSHKKEVGILGINIDITDAKLAEKVIRDSEIKYKMLMQQASDGIYLCDRLGNISDANPKACDMFGYSMNEFRGLNIKELLDPEVARELPAGIPDLKGKKSIILERKFFKKDRTPITLELSATLLEDGKYQAIIRDITERKRLEYILKDNERKFRALIENLSEVIIILSKDFKLNFISSTAHKILGYDPEKLIGKSAFELLDPQEAEVFSNFLSESLLHPGENYTTRELRVKDSKGEYLYVEVVAVNLLSDPIINGIIINFHDITRRKKTELELINTNFELDSFVYKASHDLKAPLRSVMGLIKLAKLESKDDVQQVYLDMMNKSVLTLDAFIRDLTQFSRNSRMEIEGRPVDFDEVINEALTILKFMENADKVKVNRKISIKSIFYSDLTRLSTILNNLISNAFKYHRFENNNSYINITIEADMEKSVIIVEDNGSGIDPLYIDRIFDMFYRASEISYGSGLGLYIVKNAVAKLHGSINVESILGEGTKFTVVIPNLIKNIEKQ